MDTEPVRRVICSHIRELVTEAEGLIASIDYRTFPAPADGAEVEGAARTLIVMERAMNLLQHAEAELNDERLRLRDGWT